MELLRKRDNPEYKVSHLSLDHQLPCTFLCRFWMHLSIPKVVRVGILDCFDWPLWGLADVPILLGCYWFLDQTPLVSRIRPSTSQWMYTCHTNLLMHAEMISINGILSVDTIYYLDAFTSLLRKENGNSCFPVQLFCPELWLLFLSPLLASWTSFFPFNLFYFIFPFLGVLAVVISEFQIIPSQSLDCCTIVQLFQMCFMLAFGG